LPYKDKEKAKETRSKPENKARHNAYLKEYNSRPKVIARKKVYSSRPEIKVKKKEDDLKPEVKARTKEITNTLIHITDNTQNDSFTDKYLEEINLDLSKSLMFFTFNNIDNINPILRDRMIIIKVNKYSLNDKKELCKNFLIKEICLSYNIKLDDIIIKDEDIEYIINRTTEEEGVRNLQRNINNIYSYINMNRFIKIDDKLITFPYTITRELINKYIIMKREDNLINLSLYL
jgi:ATP-dependent Lon protease